MQFSLLEAARQLTLEGRAEPLLSAPAGETGFQGKGEAVDQVDAFRPELEQLPLPLPTLHAKRTDGSLSPECIEGRGYAASFCPDHPGEQLSVGPRVCGCQACESSREANTKERARDAWNGTADDPEERRAFRHLAGIPWAVFVWTLPAELRALCTGNRLRAFRKAAGEMSLEVLQRHGAGDAQFYGRSWLHPVGDAKLPGEVGEGESESEDGTAYAPHENVIVPLVGYRDGRGHRLKPLLPKSWLGAEGWVAERWRERLVRVFGRWWSEGPAPTCNWFFEYRDTPEKQKHALRYFARVFPAWAHHPKVPLRPRAFGLAHWKHREELETVASALEPAPAYGACPHGTPAAPCPAPVCVGGSTEEEVRATAAQVVARSRGAAPYLESWRIMGWAYAPEGPAPPGPWPPEGQKSARTDSSPLSA